MALINCPECGNQVSTNAVSCPKCGAPIASSEIHTPTTTIQKTSKPLKKQQLISVMIVVFGFMLGNGGTSYHMPVVTVVGYILMAIGVIWACTTQLNIWWHHG